jgi:hypothetical protein
VVEKLAGKINPKVINTGIHKLMMEVWKGTGSSVFFDKYLATKISKTRDANVEV